MSKKSSTRKKSHHSNDKVTTTDCNNEFFAGITVYVVPVLIIKARCNIFKTQIQKFGGLFTAKYNNSVTHVVVSEKLTIEQFHKHFKNDVVLRDDVTVLTSIWLSQCLHEKKLVDFSEYLFDISSTTKTATATTSDIARKEPQSDPQSINPELRSESTILGSEQPSTSGSCQKTLQEPPLGLSIPPLGSHIQKRKRKNSGDSDYTGSDSDVEIPKPKIPKGNWVCSIPSTAPKKENPNKHITDKLEKLAKVYNSTNDKWRVLGYQKAITALKNCPTAITTWEEAKALKGVGQRLTDKIWEIIDSGELRKLDQLSASDDITALNTFTNVWGAGPKTAQVWVDQGLRTLDDLRTKAKLTRQQQIGLRLYDDLLERMPREEAAQIEATVKEAALSINPDMIAMACGSYRRGKTTCGDVDVLITHPDGKSHKGVFHVILDKLRKTGFLTDDLVTNYDDGSQKKYLGVCKLPGDNTKHRRLDIIVVPYSEFACALMYFTGSAHLNRSMRNLAGKMGMSLSEHALRTGVVRRNGEKIYEGTALPTPTEESVFEHLGLIYRPPQERDH